jgi:hypothetical protein
MGSAADRASAETQTAGKTMSLRILALSDAHLWSKLPDVEVLISAGDAKLCGSFADLQAKVAWVQSRLGGHNAIVHNSRIGGSWGANAGTEAAQGAQDGGEIRRCSGVGLLVLRDAISRRRTWKTDR